MRRTVKHLSFAAIIAFGLWAPADALADVCSLTSYGTSCGPAGSDTTDPTFEVGGSLFYHMTQQPTGTGVIDPFVRVHVEGSGNVESGYNTSGTLEFETKSGIWTHPIQLGDVPIVTDIDGDGIDDGVYREFLLDINEPVNGTKRYISLDDLQFFLSDSPDLTGYDSGSNTLAGLPAVYDLDASGDNYILLNYVLNSGSGTGDMIAYIPNTYFTGSGITDDTYLYLYSQFGNVKPAEDGFEEWWVDKSHLKNPPPPDPVPEPGTAALLGLGVIFAVRRLRARRRA